MRDKCGTHARHAQNGRICSKTVGALQLARSSKMFQATLYFELKNPFSRPILAKQIEWIFTENLPARVMRDMRDTTLDLSRIVSGLSMNCVPHVRYDGFGRPHWVLGNVFHQKRKVQYPNFIPEKSRPQNIVLPWRNHGLNAPQRCGTDGS